MSDLPALTFLDDLLDDDAPLPVVAIAMLVAIPLLLVPLLIFWMGPGLELLFTTVLWRQMLLPPALIAYSLFLVPQLRYLRNQVVDSLWPVVDVGERSRTELLADVSRRDLRGEVIALLMGLILGLALNVRGLIVQPSTPIALGVIGFVLSWMMGAWIVFYCIRIARSTNRLLSLPVTVDLFDLRPFEPIGRLALMMSLALIGGVLISLLLGFSHQAILAPEFWLAYGLLVAVALAIFFLAMSRTHRLLSTTKADLLAQAEEHLAGLFADVRNRRQPRPEMPQLAAELQAWILYRDALRETRTWPYNTHALRTLSVSILSPLFIGLARLLGILMTSN